MLEAVEQAAITGPIVLKKTGQYEIVLDNVSGKIYAQIERGAYWRLKNPQVTPVAPPGLQLYRLHSITKVHFRFSGQY
ncbi:MAG: hypothetical protein QW262_05510 [Candidatus Bathyarchaeia archaeon]